MYYLRLTWNFICLSTLDELAHRANFYISLLHGLLALLTGVLGVMIVFSPVEAVNGWTFESALLVLGVYLTVGAVRGLVISPSLDALAGLGGEVWDGRFDFTLLKPVDVQFYVSLRRWRPLALFDLALGLGTLAVAAYQLGGTITPGQVIAFTVMLGAGLLIIYAILLFFTALVFWSPGFLFTWIFDGIFQMARYPLGLYPGWVRLILTWIIPVGLVTTVPAGALQGSLPGGILLVTGLFALALCGGASWFFRQALRRYASASS